VPDRPADIASKLEALLSRKLAADDWQQAREIAGDFIVAIDDGADLEAIGIRVDALLGRRITGKTNLDMDDPTAQAADHDTWDVITRGIEHGRRAWDDTGSNGHDPSPR
jgi:hypothetical protein